jgi:hypothetical protein
MNQLKDEVLCKYCLGCNRLEDPNFAGWRRCKGFVAGYPNWKQEYYKSLNNERTKINFKKK